jgi:hypothetical protein
MAQEEFAEDHRACLQDEGLRRFRHRVGDLLRPALYL